MKILPTFVPYLLAFKYSEDEPDELERIFDQWEDPIYLSEFFEENEHDLSVSIDEAISKVRSEAKFLRKKLIELTTKEPIRLNELFKNLDNNEITPKLLSPQKAPNRWLRIYAIRIDENNYIITGGTIKLDGGLIAVHNQYQMQDRDHTNEELKKINRCRDYLLDQGVIDEDSFNEIFEL
ncbi:MAG: hypothetical protein R3353_01030 [Salegentibacter mishustinae]|nr:hypothetical protein [Salegentibacter mishustinae]